MTRDKTLIVTRHFADFNMLGSRGFDGHLRPGQEELLRRTAEKIAVAAQDRNVRRISILFNELIRTRQTAFKLAGALAHLCGAAVTLGRHPALTELDQGRPNLPPDYKDGERFPALTDAWNAFIHESYTLGNLDYRFGEARGRADYPALENSFSLPGESLRDVLRRQYPFFIELMSDEFHEPGTLRVLVSQTTTLMTLKGLKDVASAMNKGALEACEPEQLPRLFWEVFTGDGKTIPDDPAFGAVECFDMNHFANSPLLPCLGRAARFFGAAPPRP